VKIKARLAGHEFDLVALGELFREGDPAVAADDEGYYFNFTAADDLMHDGSRLHEVASSLLHRSTALGACGAASFVRYASPDASATMPEGSTRSPWRRRPRPVGPPFP